MTLAVSDIVGDIREGMIPAAIYSDDEVFRLEQERVFGRAWMFMAHESEIPAPGDYVVRRILDDSFIVVRDEHDEVRVLFNMCLHRGMQVCRSELGNASHFRCPYHAWTYKNTGELVGVPFHKDAYGGEDGLRREGTTLLPAPRTAIHNGLVFASLDEDAPSLEEYLGGFAFYLDFYTRQSEAGLEVRGPQRWIVESNWKIGAENFCGDTYHTPHTHASVVEIGLFKEPKAKKRKEGALYFAGVGGGTTYKLPGTDFAENLEHIGYPAEMVAAHGRAVVARAAGDGGGDRLHAERGDDPAQPQLRSQLAAGRTRTGLVAPFISLRLWQPVRGQRRPRSSPGSPSTSSPPTGTRPRRTRRTSCASGRPGCSSRTTWRTGRRSPRWRRGSSPTGSSSTAGWGSARTVTLCARRSRTGRRRAGRSSASASTTSARCSSSGAT